MQKTQPIKSVIAYLRNKRSSTVQDQSSPVKDKKKSLNKYNCLSSAANKKERLPLMNKFQQSCNELFSKISTLQCFISSLEQQLRQLSICFSKSYKLTEKSSKENNQMMVDIKNYNRKIEEILGDIKHKMSTVYSLEDSKEKVIDQLKEISIKIDRGDLLERKISKLEQVENHFQSVVVDLKNCSHKQRLDLKNKTRMGKMDRTLKQKHYSSVHY